MFAFMSLRRLLPRLIAMTLFASLLSSAPARAGRPGSSCAILVPSAQAASGEKSGAHAEETTAPDAWWKHAVIYEIYPRSFQDSNGDGIGDINGITSRLDYLHDLGIDAIWITPMYPSPGVDYGYDISDYTSLDPTYGTMADFDHMVAEAKKRNIRVIMDYVINHTSDQHPWFLESRSSRENPKRDWYIWRDGKPGSAPVANSHAGPGGKPLAPGRPAPPNNWQSWFGHSAWTWDETTKQYYYHYFYVQQPDLNWRNPEVKKAMFSVLDFWMQHGVAGFRIDAVSRLFEDPEMRDDPYLPGYNAYGDRNIQHKYTDDLPQVHDILRELRQTVDKFPGDPVLVTEADEPDIAALTKMYGTGKGDEVQLPMDFQIADVNELSAPKFRERFDEVEANSANGQPEYFFSNHDQPRQYDRYSTETSDPRQKDQIARLMAALLLTSRGTPQMYYGEELGMTTTEPTRIEDVHDPIGKIGWPKEKGRDGERTPMQWTAGIHAGFTMEKPWLPIPASAKTYNVETEQAEPNSILNTYKRLLKLRKQEVALREGNYKSLDPGNEYVFAFERTAPLPKGEVTVIVALNMSNRARTVDLRRPSAVASSEPGGQGGAAASTVATGDVLYRSPLGPGGTAPEVLPLGQSVELPAFGVLVVRVK